MLTDFVCLYTYENDTESDYTCTICGTDLKQITDGTNNEETLAKSLLLEENETRTDEAIQSEEKEQQQQCIKCDKTMKRIESDICIVCDNQCHIHCMEYHLFVLRFVMGLAFVVL
jgi:rRNA maturation endonuclease Nob1